MLTLMYTFYYWDHSLKKQKDSLETWAIYKEISLISWNLPNGPKHRRSILKNMASSERDQLHAGAFHAIVEKIKVDILQIAKKWIWKLIFIYQGYFYRKIPAINASFAPKSVLHLHGWSLKFGQNCKDVGIKILKCDVNRAQVNNKKKDLCLNSTDKTSLKKFQRKRYGFRLGVFVSISNAFTFGI